MEQRRVMIIGGGIGGLTAANALKSSDVDTVVYERAKDVRHIQTGGGLHLWSNAMKAMARIGLADQVRAVGAPLLRQQFFTWRGRMLGDWPVEQLGQEMGAPSVILHRADLHRVLMAGLPEGIVQFGRKATGFEQDTTGVTAHFADGTQERGDVLIGADGLQSTIRGEILGAAPPRYAGFNIWQGMTDFQDPSFPEGVLRLLLGPGSGFFFHHVGPNRLFWVATQGMPENGSNGQTDAKTLLLDRHKGWMAPTEAIIQATETSEIRHAPMYDRKPAKQWGTGRVTLLGDAAHAMTFNAGQGACQGIEDGVVLAECVRDSADLVSALRAYEARRIPRTTSLVNQSHFFGRLSSFGNPVFCAARDEVMKVLLNTMIWRTQRQRVAQQF